MRIIKKITYLLIIFCSIACVQNTNQANKKEKKKSEKLSDTSITDSKLNTAKKTILFFGNSLTAGLGVDPSEAFAGLIEKRLDSLKMPYQVVNSGVSGETTAGGLGRIDWILDQYPIDVFILELGGNDALRGVDPASSEKNLQAIVERVKSKVPEATIILAGMEAPPNLGQEFTSAFRKMYKTIAKENDLLLIPFLLEGVGGVPEFNQKDGIHPTPQGHKIVAEVVWKTLEKAL